MTKILRERGISCVKMHRLGSLRVWMQAGSATTWSDQINPAERPVTPLRYVPGFHLKFRKNNEHQFCQCVSIADNLFADHQ